METPNSRAPPIPKRCQPLRAMKKSSLHEKTVSAVCLALFRGMIKAVPTKEQFLAEFCPKLATPYNPLSSRPISGIRINKNGRCVNWGTKGAIQSQNTKRANEADRIWTECLVLIESELKRQ